MPEDMETQAASEKFPKDVFYSRNVGVFLCFHSDYKGYKIYRQWNVLAGRAMMSYFGIKWRDPEHVDSDSVFLVQLHARNLSGIKAAITKVKV